MKNLKVSNCQFEFVCTAKTGVTIPAGGSRVIMLDVPAGHVNHPIKYSLSEYRKNCLTEIIDCAHSVSDGQLESCYNKATGVATTLRGVEFVKLRNNGEIEHTVSQGDVILESDLSEFGKVIIQ